MKPTILTALVFLTTLSASAQPQKPMSLHDEILQQDTAMFEAFNAHQLDKVAAYFDDSLEFYHDQGGLTGKRESLAGIKGMFDQNNGMRRDLVGTLEVYPIKDYGAIEIGAHRFCHQENGKDDCGTFKFLHVWQKQKDGWKITRVVSYDH